MSALAPSSAAAATAGSARPSTLTSLCIIGLALAVFALLAAATSVSGAFGSSNPFQSLSELGQPAEVVEMQRAMQAEINAAMAPWATWYAVLSGLNLLLAAGLIAGGVLTLRLRRPGVEVYWLTFALGLVTDGLAIVPTVAVQRATFAAIDGQLGRLLAQAQSPPGMPGFGETMQGIMRASMIAGAAFAVLMILGKLGFYVWGSWYLKQPRIRSLFS